MTTTDVLELLQGVKVERPGQWAARCPAHDDKKPSLGIRTGDDGRVLLHCQAGCKLDEITAALRISEADLFPPRAPAAGGKREIGAVYSYLDERGQLLFEVVRFVPKDFRQRRPDGQGGYVWKLEGVRRVLYRLPELLAAAPDQLVYIPEGEKDVDALIALGLVATCNPHGGGPGKWAPVAEQARAVLRGRHVVVLPDNDDPGRAHAREIAAALRGSAASVRVLALPGLPDKGDVSDWLRAGGAPAALRQLVDQVQTAAAPELVGIDHGTFSERLRGERDERLAMAKQGVPFELAFLDDRLRVLMPRDLIIITARSGSGKTELASMVAENGTRHGRRVTMFALEAERREIERRIKWRSLARFWLDSVEPIRRRNREQPIELDYDAWYRGELDQHFAEFEDQMDKWLGQQIGDRMRTIYRGESFTLDDTERAMLALQDATDLFILDHLDMVDFDEGTTEQAAQKAIVQRIRHLAIVMGKPVVLVAHVRKESATRPTLVPQRDEIYGSSHIAKLVTCIVSMAPGPRSKDWWAAPTFTQIVKRRRGGEDGLVALTVYDRRTGMYENKYQLGRITRDKQGYESWTRLEDSEIPPWAERCERQTAQTRLGGL